MEHSLKTEKDLIDLMFMLGLNETIDKLTVANSVRWYGHAVRTKDVYVLRSALDFEVEDQRKKGRPKKT